MSLRSAIHVVALLALATPAHAQSVCGDRAEIIRVLAGKYQELPRAFGVTGGERILAELFVSKSGSWTMLMTQSRGVTCILATGVDWQEMPPPITGKPT